MVDKKKGLLIGVISVIAITVIIVLYKRISPTESVYFPQCPSYKYFGIECPGCGSQRALHHLLNGKFGAAFKVNPILVLAIPYLGILLWLEVHFRLKGGYTTTLRKIRDVMCGKWAIYTIVAILILYTIIRNIT